MAPDAAQVDPGVVLGLAAVPIVMMLVDAIKGLFPRLPRRTWPALAVLVALALNLGVGLCLGLSPVSAMVVGLLAAQAAMDFYELTRSPTRRQVRGRR
jgi:hypothetical protein